MTKEYYEAHKDEICNRQRQKRASDPEWAEKARQKSKDYYYSKTKTSKQGVLKHRQRARIAQKRLRERKQEIRRKLQQTLGGKCVDCGITDWRLLDFDHIDPKLKRCNISQVLHKPREFLLEELKNCELRCPNCHRIKTMTKDEHNSYRLRKFRNPYRTKGWSTKGF